MGNLGRHWFRQWLVAWSAPSHYLKQWWNIINWTSIGINFSEISASEKRRYICNIFSHWLRPCSAIDRKPAQVADYYFVAFIVFIVSYLVLYTICCNTVLCYARIHMYLVLINRGYINGLKQNCSDAIANALELLQSCTKPSIYCLS